jgi:DNA-binding transcriptional LysR family regulator
MNLKEPLYVYAIYENKSISKAARELNITQPALSKFLINLEKTTGSPLFDKSNNNYVPTFLGKQYIKYAKEILETQRLWQKEKSQIINSNKGALIISIPIIRSSVLLTQIIPNFLQKYPFVKVQVKEVTASLNVDFFELGQFDLAIYNPTKFVDTYNYELLYSEEIVAIGDINNKILNNTIEKNEIKLNLSKLKNTSLIMQPTNLSTGKRVSKLLKEKNIIPNIQMETRNPDLAIASVVNSNIITFAPKSYAKEYAKVYPIKYIGIGEYTKLYCIYKNGKYLPSYTRYFIDKMKEYYKDISHCNS